MDKKAFTLLEIILYIGLLTLFLAITGGIAINIIFNKTKLSVIQEVSQNGRFAMEKIYNSIINSDGVNVPISGQSGAVLSLVVADSLKNPTIFDLSSGILRIKEGNSQPVDLTSDKVIVTSLSFSNVSYTNTPGTIKVQMSIKFKNPDNRQEYNLEKTFYSSANIRKKQ